MMGAFVVGIDFDLVVICIGDGSGDTIPTDIPNDGVVDTAWFDAAFTVDPAIAFNHSVARDACDPFAEYDGALEDRGISGVIGLGSDRSMATHAERARRASCQLKDCLFEALKHR